MKSRWVCGLNVPLSSSLASGADSWPQWRSPSWNGAADSADLPVSWKEMEGPPALLERPESGDLGGSHFHAIAWRRR